MARTKKIGKVEPVQKTVLNKQEAMAYLGVSEDYPHQATRKQRSSLSSRWAYDMV